MDERARRRWAAVETRALGRGGIVAVATATGMSDRIIRNGLKELADPAALTSHRQRKSGGGRKAHAATQPDLKTALESLIEPTTRGAPTNPLRWTLKSTHRLAAELRTQGHTVSATSVRRMLRAMNYSLQSNRKTREGAQHPDRDGQFRHIHDRVKARQHRGEPAISVDTKKKEVLGNLKNSGQTYRPTGDPQKVKTHDFRCPIGQGHELFTALQRNKVPSRFVNFPDEGHWVLKPKNSERWHQEVFGWLAKYCPPGGK